MPEVSGAFHVALHDVEPTSIDAIEHVLRALDPLVGRRLSMAMVPCWHGRRLTRADTRHLAVASRADEVLLHGWTHRRTGRAGLVSVVTGRSDEFARLSRAEAGSRLARGRELLEDLLDRSVKGFLAPAFQRGRVDTELADHAGLSFLVGWSRVESVRSAAVPLATTFWDLSPRLRLGWLGEACGWLAARRRRALPVVAIHPCDVQHGDLPRALAMVRTLLAEGRRPVLLESLVHDRNGPA